MRKKSFYLSLLFLLFGYIFHAQDFDSVIESANTAFEDQKFDDAINEYKKVIGGGQHSLAIYNNLGSAYYEKGDIANSILFFEKGLKIDPFDKSVLHNLSLAKEQLDSDIVVIPEFILKRAWKYLFTRTSSNTWYLLGFLFALLSVLCFGAWLLHSDRSLKKKGFFAGIVTLFMSILFFCFSASQAKFQYEIKTAIVIDDGISLKSAPEEANEAIMTLLPGTKLFIMDKIETYEKVRLENGQLGWVPAGSYHSI